MKSNAFRKVMLLIVVSFSIFVLSCKKDDPGANEVWIDNNSYSPSSITVSMGTTITWTNKENETHTVTSDGALFDSGDLTEGDTYSHTFTTAGTFPYHCQHHSEMHGTVIVN